MYTCPNCRKPIDRLASVCPYCGMTFEERTDIDAHAILIGILIVVGLFLIFPIMSTYNHISESLFDSIDRKQNVWCGYFDGSQIKLFKDDIAKGGSSICNNGYFFGSWRDGENKYLKVDGKDIFHTEFKKRFEGNVVIVEGVMEKNKYGFGDIEVIRMRKR